MFLSSLVSILLPSYCFSCRKVGPVLCKTCSLTIIPCVKIENTSFGRVISAFRYDGVVKKSIRGGKFFSVRAILEDVVRSVPEDMWGTTVSWMRTDQTWVVMPIPLHKTRLKERGFNQADVIGVHIAQKLDIPFHNRLLVRVKKTLQQATLTRRDRMRNVRNAFESVQDVAVPYGVILVDDVWTTGSTMKEAAKTLYSAGVAEVHMCVLAR